MKNEWCWSWCVDQYQSNSSLFFVILRTNLSPYTHKASALQLSSIANPRVKFRTLSFRVWSWPLNPHSLATLCSFRTGYLLCEGAMKCVHEVFFMNLSHAAELKLEQFANWSNPGTPFHFLQFLCSVTEEPVIPHYVQLSSRERRKKEERTQPCNCMCCVPMKLPCLQHEFRRNQPSFFSRTFLGLLT